VAVRESGEDADVLDDVSDDEADGGEDKNAAEAVVLRAVDEGEGEGGEDFEGDDGSGGSAGGKDLEDAGEGVESEEGYKRDGDGAISLLSRGLGCRENGLWHQS
jgi:hypothetical protein